jgi:GNAT superfamily N-acetyltransferase
MIAFTPFAQHKPGIVVSLLSQSYAAYLALDPQAAQAWPAGWAAYDQDVFRFPDTVGACGFVTCLQGQAIGFASWDPRAFPAYGVIGHNCILPAFRGNGYGTAQIRRVLDILRARGFGEARVTTGDHPFFRPAQRMYEACGFQETGRSLGDPHSSFGTIHYRLSLDRASHHRSRGAPFHGDPMPRSGA